MYCLLVSGYTMTHEEVEKFLLNQLKGLSYEQLSNKDIRILLFDPNEPLWTNRAHHVVNRLRLFQPSITPHSPYGTLNLLP